jgi:hypothetical protein
MRKHEVRFKIEEDSGELDFSHLKPCPFCKKPIPDNATDCYYCGRKVLKKPLWLIITAIGVIILFIVLVLF